MEWESGYLCISVVIPLQLFWMGTIGQTRQLGCLISRFLACVLAAA